MIVVVTILINSRSTHFWVFWQNGSRVTSNRYKKKKIEKSKLKNFESFKVNIKSSNQLKAQKIALNINKISSSNDLLNDCNFLHLQLLLFIDISIYVYLTKKKSFEGSTVSESVNIDVARNRY